MIRKSFTLLGALLVVFSNVLFAQNCSTNPTYKNSSGTYDLSVQGRSYAVDNGSTVDVTITKGFLSTSSICVTNGSTLNLAFSNLSNLVPGAIIYVDATSKLNFVGSNVSVFPFTINNYGTITQSINITYQNGALVNNYGTYTTSNSVTFSNRITTVNNSGTMTLLGSLVFTSNTSSTGFDFIFTNTADGKITIKNNVTLNRVRFYNQGTINFNGTVNIQNDCRFVNSGYANLNSNLTITKSTITNYGVFTVANDVKVSPSGILDNYCNFLCGHNFTNSSVVTNNGNLLMPVGAASSFTNNSGATFTNTVNGFVQGYDFDNGGSISGSGNFYFAHSTKNTGPFSGTATSYINFYDASNTTNNIFDNTYNPGFTTKKIIAPKKVEDITPCGDLAVPVITNQPLSTTLCDNSIKSAIFSVVASGPSYGNISYQWLKNGIALPNATSSSYTADNLTLADTANVYSVSITNEYGTITSNGVSVHYLIVAQPFPASLYLATGNSTSFAIKTSGATALQWQKNNTNIADAISETYTIPSVNLTDAGNYTALVTHDGGTCTSNAATLTTSIVLYSKSSGDMNDPSTWGVNADGSGSSPVDFTRDEHTFIVANRKNISNSSDLTIAGKLDLNNGIVTITPGTTLTVGRIKRSLSSGVIAGSATSSLSVQGISTSAYAGTSNLYFQTGSNVLQNLTIARHTVALQTALNIAAGTNPGKLQVTSGTFNTSDLLTLKSDVLGTAIVAESHGIINGKVTIERYIPARRAWRILCAPVSAVDAPTINAAWQEGATSSTDNPYPGYGTHITYGNLADGFDQNPQKSFSMYYYNDGKWSAIPATNKTPVTYNSALLLFIRGNRSYNITGTTSSTTPTSTILRTSGYLNQGKQADVQVNLSGFTPIANPYASPIDFEQVYNNSSNIKHTIRVWDPSLAGSKGVGAYITLDWNGNGYKATPPSSLTNMIQPYQAFFVQSTNGIAGKISINEAAKNTATVSNPFGRKTGREIQDALLEVNLRVFNDDGSTGIADGVLYRFNDEYNNNIDEDDINKMSNLNENLSILSNDTLLTIERRTMPQATDTLHLNLTGTKTTDYQLEIIPGAFNKSSLLYDNYLKTYSPISATDTSRFTISINAADALSKASNRFSIVMQQVALPVTFNTVKVYAKGKTVQVEWNVASETDVQYYEVERSTNGVTFTKTGQVFANGALNYSFNDVSPFDGTSYYRVKSVDKSGKTTYTKVMPVTIDNNAISNLTIYPNPLKGKTFQVQISNKLAGTYTLQLISNSGQQLHNQTISYNGGIATYPIQLNKYIAHGLYFIKVIAADGSEDIIKVIVQ